MGIYEATVTKTESSLGKFSKEVQKFTQMLRIYFYQSSK